MPVTLGLDLGPNSIGWALVDRANEKLIGQGVRVFPEGVNRFNTNREESRNETRRNARLVRRQTRRRAERKGALRNALIEAGLLPEAARPPREGKAGYDAQRQAWRAYNEQISREDPYELRRRGVDPNAEPLTPYQVGRAILHLNQRRGFLSNSKKEETDREVQGMLAQIKALRSKLDGQTLGQRLADIHDNPLARVRGMHTHRDMLRDEFDRLWRTQAEHHPDLLSERARFGKAGPREVRKPQDVDERARTYDQTWFEAFGIEGIIFFQRKMYWPKSAVGLCELETGERRCPKADRAAQRFRLLQEVNNLRLIDESRNLERELFTEERALLLDKLAQVKQMEFGQIKKILAELPTFPPLEQAAFNLEKGKRPKLLGHVTDYLLAKADKAWRKRDNSEKDEIVRLLLDPNLDDDQVKARLLNDYSINEQQADKLVSVDLPDGYQEVSLKAIDKLLPYLEEGLPMMAGAGRDEQGNPTDAMHAAGYDRPDELQKRVFGKLPRLDEVRTGKLASLPNPVVRAALYEIRKVVNSILREYFPDGGKPDEVHIELARDLKMGHEARQKHNANMREKEEQRNNAIEKLREMPRVSINRPNIAKLLLWEQQNYVCPYTGDPISKDQLFHTGEADIDHILPRSRSLDDSQMNKVVAFRSANAAKGNQTPYEWRADKEPEQYDRMCQLARRLPYPKRRRFLQKQLDSDDFIARQLRDTAYIGRATAEYLRLLFQENSRVLCLKGQHTSTLRWHWGLETLLSDLPDSPAWCENNDRRPGEKNRSDHRHHAIDAIVVALTDDSCLKQLARGFEEVERIDRDTGELTHRKAYRGKSIAPPWHGFRDAVEAAIQSINVSHRPRRQTQGQLHLDTIHGPAKDVSGTPVDGEFVMRKPLEDLSPSEVERVVDPVVRRKVLERLKDHNAAPGRGKSSIPKSVWAEALWMNEAKGVQIKKVRVRKLDQTIEPIRQSRDETDQIAYVKPGSLHHACLFQWEANGKTVYDAKYVTRLEARKRISRREPIVQPTHDECPEARFVMSLCPGDMVVIIEDDRERLMMVSTLVSSEDQKRVHVVDANDARPSTGDHKRKDKGLTPTSLLGKYDARKVTVDAIGRLRNAQRFRITTDTPADAEVTALAADRVAGKISRRAMVKRLERLGKAHLGALLTAEIHRLRQNQD